jgi:two-component system chemotaxis response regulator CheB
VGRTALICDDDPVLRGVVAEMVGAHGWNASETATAKGAILLADLLQPDLVVMDVALSGMSGLEATPRIHADCPKARIVVLSSFDWPRQVCLAAGAIEVVKKRELPQLDDLLERLDTRCKAEEGLARLYDELMGGE